MPIAAIRIDEALWENASPERRHEWRQALSDLLDDHSAAAPPLHLAIRMDDGATIIDARAEDGSPFATLELPMARLAPHFKEYFDICREMGRLGVNSQSPRLEALDIAKRLTHDEAAETLLALCKPLAPDHATCRRLFTLLVTLHFDTTRLLLPHHRR